MNQNNHPYIDDLDILDEPDEEDYDLRPARGLSAAVTISAFLYIAILLIVWAAFAVHRG